MLTYTQLSTVLRPLSQHHSRDPQLIARIHREMATYGAPWRCKFCVRMVSPTAGYCGGCWGPWSLCNDPTYIHKPNRKKDSQHQYSQGYTSSWTDAPWEAEEEEPWQRGRKTKSPRRRTQSPRQRSMSARARSKNQRGEEPPDFADGKGQEKGKGAKGGAVAFGHLPPSTQWMTPPTAPFQQEPLTSTASTSTALQPFGKARNDKDDAELIALRHLHAQVRGHSSEQSEEVKKALAVIESSIRKDDAKSYKQLIYLLTQARKRLADIEEQWDAFRTQWTTYLDTATKMWTAHIESYEEGETKFSQKRKEAAIHLQQVRTQLHEISCENDVSRRSSTFRRTPRRADCTRCHHDHLRHGHCRRAAAIQSAEDRAARSCAEGQRDHRGETSQEAPNLRGEARRRCADCGDTRCPSTGIYKALTLHASDEEAEQMKYFINEARRGEGRVLRRTKWRCLAFWPTVSTIHHQGQRGQELCHFFSDSDVGVEKCSRHNLDVIADWTPPPPHSVNEEPDFVSLWEAQTRALLLSSSLNFPGLAPHFDKIFFENFIHDRKHPVPVEDLIELGIIPTTRPASVPVYEETQDIDKQFSESDVPHFGPCHDRPDPNEVPNVADPPSDSDVSGQHGHQRQDRRPPLRRFPAWVTDLWNLLQSDGATEHLEEGPVIYLGSYYVSHETCPQQHERRPIRLDRHYESWAQQIEQVWHDHFDHSRGFELHLVAPEPPIPVTHGIVGIILIVQHPVRGQEAVLTTTVYDALDGRHVTESAHSMPRLVEPSIVLERAGALARCQAVESQGFGPCYIRSGPHVFNRHQPLRCHDGLGLVIRIPELQPDDDDEIQTIEQLRRDDRNAAPPDETDEVQMMARQPRLRESSTSPSTSSSDTTCSIVSDSWQRTVIFAIDGSVRSLMLPQNDDNLMRSRIAAAFELEPHEVHDVFPVNERPDDLVEMELQGQLLQTVRDHRHPPIMRLLLVDIEVFIEQEILPFAFRRNTMWLPHTTTRLTLLRLLGVESLCQHHEQGCRVWHNNDPIPPDTSLPLRLNDGDYVHVFIGNDDQMQCTNLGMDDFALLQTVPAAQLRTADSHQRSVSLRRCSFHGQPVRRRQNHHDEDPDDAEQLRQLQDLWNRPERRHRGMQNEEVMLFETWYLCSMNHPRCSYPRTIALPHDLRLWPLRIAQVWRDRFRPHWAYRIIPIRPEPMHERHGGHLLIIQHEHPDEAGILMSQYRGSRDGQHHDRFAQLVPRLLSFDRYLWFQDHEILCAQDDIRCEGFHGNTPIPTQGAWPALTGQHLELYVTARSLDEDDVVMIQTSNNADAQAPGHQDDPKRQHFSFDVNAPPFAPEVDNNAMLQLPSMTERRQTAGQVAHTQRPPRQVLSLAACVNPPPSVRVDFSHVFAIDRDLQHSFNYFQQEWPRELPQPEVMSNAMDSLVRCSGQLPFAYHFFTDGSKAAEGNVGAAIILLTQSIDGWHYGGCLYKRVVAGDNSAAGENGALIWALLWAISISNERWFSQRTIDIIYTFNFDSTSAGFVAAGYWKSRAHLNWRIIQRSLAQILQTRHGLHRLQWNHIHAHAGHPWNEGADTLAKFATTTSAEVNGSQCWEKWLDDADSLNALQWIWFKELMEAGDPRVPMLQDEHLVSHLTAVRDWNASQQQPTNLPAPPACPTESKRLDITIATANVLTLATTDSRTSSASRQLVLMQQFEEAHCHIIGIQETRHKHIVCQNNEYYHIYGSPATKEGQDGIQLWVSKRLPFGPHGEVIQHEHVRVVASASNYLVVKVRFAAWRCLIVTCRAPHSGRPIEEGRAFWANLTSVIQRKGAGLPLFFCGDANAHVGEIVTDAIGPHFSAKENQAGSLFHNWLLQHGLYLPANVH